MSDSDIVNTIADVMQSPPVPVTSLHASKCSWVATFLNAPVTSRLPAISPAAPVLSNVNFINNVVRSVLSGDRQAVTNSLTQPRIWTGDSHDVSIAYAAQAQVMAIAERVCDFSDRAKLAGLEPPSNPFVMIARYNGARIASPTARIQAPAAELSAVVFNIKAYVDLLEAYDGGALSVENGTVNVAQMTHVGLSFNGLGGTGNPAADIKTFLPSADALKKEAARQALEVLDFSKRVPYLLFTADYRPRADGPSQGTLVSWKKIPDASGYTVWRRAIFSGHEQSFDVDNASLVASSAALLPYARSFAVSFFDNVDNRLVMIYRDSFDRSENEYYIYTVTAYQIRSTNQASSFSVDSVPVTLTPVAKQSIGQLIRKMSNWPNFTIVGWDSSGTPIKDYNDFQETISPWPAFAQYVYGDSSYDWVLAAMNIKASISRGDDRTITRQYSYLNAHSRFLEAQADAGKFVKPADISRVVQAINASIQKFGVSQTIQSMLDDTGITFYFEGRDPPEDAIFRRAGQLSTATSKLFATVASAIDPDTATMDIKHLATNMSALLQQQLLDVASTTLAPGTVTTSKPTQIAVPDPEESTSSAAEGSLQFINRLGDLQDSVIDLTTFDGLSKLMRVIRIMSDFGPDRLPPNSAPLDQPKPPPPPPPPGGVGERHGSSAPAVPVVPVPVAIDQPVTKRNSDGESVTKKDGGNGR